MGLYILHTVKAITRAFHKNTRYGKNAFFRTHATNGFTKDAKRNKNAAGGDFDARTEQNLLQKKASLFFSK